MKRALLGLALIVLGTAQAEEAIVTGFLNKSIPVEGGARKYVLYVPDTYIPAEPWPLIVFLHGAGERGDDGLIQSEVGIGEAIRRHSDRFPALVLMPQCEANKFWDSAVPAIEGAMAKTIADYNIDTDRIYLTGLSMGGYMAWLWGGVKADTFAAIMPICGGGKLEDIQRLLGSEKSAMDFGELDDRVKQLAKTPIWAFHGALDPVVPVMRTQLMVRLVKEAGGDVKYTEYPEAKHDSWVQAYADEDAIKWLFKQHLKKKRGK